MVQQKISFFGEFRPTGIDQTASSRLRALAGLGEQGRDIAFQIGAKQAQKRGEQAAKVERDESGQIVAPELKSDLLSIEAQAFNKATVLAYNEQITMDSRKRLDELQNEYAENPDGFERISTEYLNATLKGMPQEVADLARSNIAKSISNRTAKLRQDFFDKAKRENEAIAIDGIESRTDEALTLARAGDKEALTSSMIDFNSALDAWVDAGTIDPRKAVQLKEELEERIAKQAALADVDSIIFSKELTDDQKLEKGAALLESLRTKDLKDLDPDQKDALINVISGRLGDLNNKILQAKAELTLEETRQISNLKVSAKQGFDDAQSIIEETEDLFNRKKISGNERTAILNDVFNGQSQKAKKIQDFSLVAKKLSGDNPEIVLDQKTVDAYYDEVVTQNLEGMPKEVRTASQAEYVTVLKAVPKSLKQEISNQLLSNDPDLIMEANDIIGRLDEVAGLTDLAVEPSQRAFANTLTSLSQSMPAEEAVKLARELTDPRDQARIKLKEEEISTEKYRNKYPDIIDDEFDAIDNINKQKLITEYQNLFESHFKAGNTKDAAKENALRIMKANWRESDFGLMKHPPEIYYSVGGDTEYIRDQLVNDLRRFVVTEGDKISSKYQFEPENVYLFSDRETAKGASKGQPDYRVAIINNNGEFEPIPTRWRPDIEAQQQKQLKRNEKIAQQIRSSKLKREPEEQEFEMLTGKL